MAELRTFRGYRCAGCVDKPERCAACRVRRAAARNATRAAHLAAGVCSECGRPVRAAGETLCADHARDNAIRSGLSHGRRRKRESP